MEGNIEVQAYPTNNKINNKSLTERKGLSMSFATQFFSFLSTNPFILGLLIICIPPFQFLLTYIHECGHALHLLLISLIHKEKIQYLKIVPPINKPKEWKKYRTFVLYYGKTYSNIYKYMETNHAYLAIRINAVCGSLFTIFILSIAYFIGLNQNILFLQVTCAVSIFFRVLKFYSNF